MKPYSQLYYPPIVQKQVPIRPYALDFRNTYAFLARFGLHRNHRAGSCHFYVLTQEKKKN